MNGSLIPSAHRCFYALGGRYSEEIERADAGIGSKLARQRRQSKPMLIVLALGLAAITGMMSAEAQDERRTRVPALGKTAGGPSRQAFSGKVQSVDLKRNLLKVDTVEGGATEIFPLKKRTPVTMADGTKIELRNLAPGTNVIVYFEQREDRRTVSKIIVLAASEGEGEKKSPPPS